MCFLSLYSTLVMHSHFLIFPIYTMAFSMSHCLIADSQKGKERNMKKGISPLNPLQDTTAGGGGERLATVVEGAKATVTCLFAPLWSEEAITDQSTDPW